MYPKAADRKERLRIYKFLTRRNFSYNKKEKTWTKNPFSVIDFFKEDFYVRNSYKIFLEFYNNKTISDIQFLNKYSGRNFKSLTPKMKNIISDTKLFFNYLNRFDEKF